MTVETLVFIFFSALTLGSAVLMVSARNLFHAGLYLMVTLFGVAGLFVLLAAPLLAGFQVVVYIGAIAILIILAIMLTPGVTQIRAVFTGHWQLSLVLALIFFLLMVSVVAPVMDDWGIAEGWNADFTEDSPPAVPPDSVTQFGKDLVDLHKYMLPFEVASVLLMAALIGAAMIVNPRDPEGKASGSKGGQS